MTWSLLRRILTAPGVSAQEANRCRLSFYATRPSALCSALVQVPLVFFLKSSHLILVASAASALGTIVCWSVGRIDAPNTKIGDSAFPQHTFGIRGVSIGGADLATVLNRKCGGMPPVR